MEKFLINKKKLKSKKFELPPDGDLSAVSIVTDPAIESSFKYFNKEQFQKDYRFSNDDEMILTGPIMRANYKMLRKDKKTGELYMGWFSSEDVKECMKRFFKNGNNRQANFEHKRKFNKEIYYFESFIVRDKDCSEAKAMGFTDYDKDDWFGSCQFTDKEDWQWVKDNGFTGFSVEVDAYVYTAIHDSNIIEMCKEIAFSNMKDNMKESILRQLLEIEE